MIVPKDDPFGIRNQYRASQYRVAFNEACREQQQVLDRLQGIEEQQKGLEHEKRELQAHLIKVTGNIEGLRPFCETEIEVESEPKLGPICYHTLCNLARPATAPELRILVSQHMNLSRYTNPLAMIHMALRRMPDRVNTFRGPDGKVYFEAIG